jgi:hypothetical protein
LSSEHPSTSEKLGNKKSSDEDDEEEATDEQPTDDDDVDVTDTMRRNRGPRPAYSDANMQHSLGYLP